MVNEPIVYTIIDYISSDLFFLVKHSFMQESLKMLYSILILGKSSCYSIINHFFFEKKNNRKEKSLWILYNQT